MKPITEFEAQAGKVESAESKSAPFKNRRVRHPKKRERRLGEVEGWATLLMTNQKSNKLLR
jgi:hypothetical protein